MPRSPFPDPRTANEDGIVAIGGPLFPELLTIAYAAGIFPWPVVGVEEPVWFSPDPRAILEFSALHIPKSLARLRKKSTLRFTRNKAFAQVIRDCAHTQRKGQKGTWITPEMITAFEALHALGEVESIEAWEGDQLVGGIYAVRSRNYVSAESMFHRKTGASKLCLLELIRHLEAEGFRWIDIQMLTPHLVALGAREISREEFLKRINSR